MYHCARKLKAGQMEEDCQGHHNKREDTETIEGTWSEEKRKIFAQFLFFTTVLKSICDEKMRVAG